MPDTVSALDLAIDLQQEIAIDAPPARAFEALLGELASLNGEMPMILEPKPGGRWFRDLGENAGHLWAHVQVVKPPTLLELVGPMFMSYPAINHLQFRVAEEGSGARLTLTHKAVGAVTLEHREGVVDGWAQCLNRTKQHAEL
ncbi:MAG: SRPBCC domain-containing protein [Planctomycetota bacterium]